MTRPRPESRHRECGLPWSHHTHMGGRVACPDEYGGEFDKALRERPKSGPFEHDQEDARWS